jgi:hypothetical protein
MHLTYHLELQPSPDQHRPLLRFTIRNDSPGPVWLLRWLTPLEGLYGDILSVTCDGQHLPYRGPMVKRGAPQSQDYVHLAPNMEATSVVDLVTGYDLPNASACSVDLARHEVMATQSDPAQATTPPGFVQVSGSPAKFQPHR